MAPYLAGAKNAACVPIRNTQAITIQPPTNGMSALLPKKKPKVNSVEMTTSDHFQKRNVNVFE